VRTLVNDNVEPGYHQVEWNGLNDVGVKVGSGVYFYKFQAEKFLDIKKMLLLK
jgi:flagellar hook assembly protein FlgD